MSLPKLHVAVLMGGWSNERPVSLMSGEGVATALEERGHRLALTGGARARLDAMIPAGHVAQVHLTLTDDHPWAQAFVIIEALPGAQQEVR